MIKINLLNGPGIQYPNKKKKLEEVLTKLDIEAEKAPGEKGKFEEEQFTEAEKKLTEEEAKTFAPQARKAPRKWKKIAILVPCALVIAGSIAIFLFRNEVSSLLSRETTSHIPSTKEKWVTHKIKNTETPQQKTKKITTAPKITTPGTPVEEIYLPDLNIGTNLLKGAADLTRKLLELIEIDYIKINLSTGSLSGILNNPTLEPHLREYITKWNYFSSMDVFFTSEETGRKKVVTIFTTNFPSQGEKSYKYFDLSKIAKVIGYSAAQSKIPVPLLKITGKNSQNWIDACVIGACNIHNFPIFLEELTNFNINIAYNSILLMRNRQGKYEFTIELKIIKERKNA